MEQHKRERAALMDHLLAKDWNVFGTLKFIDGRTIGRHSATKVLRSYWNKIDRVFFGKAAERQAVRVPRWCFAHEGSDSENYHVHFALLAPIADIEHTCCVLNAVWTQHHYQTAPLGKNWIMPLRHKKAATNYLTGEYWRLGGETLLDDLCWDRTSANTLAEYQHDAQQARILRAASPLWLNDAKQALAAQQARYQLPDEH